MAGAHVDLSFVPDSPTRAFFEGLENGKIILDKCTACGKASLGQRQCSYCGSVTFTPLQASGRGTVLTYTRVHHSNHPLFSAFTPYLAGVIDTAEGPALYMRILHESSRDISGAEGNIELMPFGGIEWCPVFVC